MSEQEDRKDLPCPCFGIAPKYTFVHATILGNLTDDISIFVLWKCNMCEGLRYERWDIQPNQLPLRLEPPEE